jgi:hypothetical protein
MLRSTSPLYSVELFASNARNAAGAAEGERPIGTTSTAGDPNTRFEARLRGDYRGQLITATLNEGPYLDSIPVRTSEFSEAVAVR